MSVPQPKSDPSPFIWGNLPTRIKVLHVIPRAQAGQWLADAFAADSAAEIVLEEAVGIPASLERIRDEVFDAVLVHHDPQHLDALELVEGLRAGGSEEPMIILGTKPSAEMAAICYEVGADAYCCLAESSTRSLLWTFARAMERFQLVRENRRLIQAERHRLAQEQTEAERLLIEQRTLIADLDAASGDQDGDELGDDALDVVDDDPEVEKKPWLRHARPRKSPEERRRELPDLLIRHYRELLRAYVVMGAGNLTNEMASLADLLADANVSAQRAVELHVYVLEEIIRGLGNRSARHVMNRADLLILEVMAHLADGYRRRYDVRQQTSPLQLWLPGIDREISPSFIARAAA